jgi:glycosyltransferase involved in cell wall biosynthesis
LELGETIHIYDAVSDELFFKILGEADILLLPSNFDSETEYFFRLSMPGKIPAYMASGTPILVYGPADLAQVRYAIREGWGYVVSQKGIRYVKQGLLKLINDNALRQSLSDTSKFQARKNYDANIVRSRFHVLLRNSAERGKGNA